MAWFKLNDSLNTLKGQISNVSNVVQEVFTEGIATESTNEQEDLEVRIKDAEKQIEQLTGLCSSQENEIAVLRRQIQDSQQHSKVSDTGGGISKSLADHGFEESWFWDTEPTTSSSSSKENEITSSKSGSPGDLTLIPLDNQGCVSELPDKLYRMIDKRDHRIKEIQLENSLLKDQIKELKVENHEVNVNIEELDRQHGLTIEKLLTLKHEIQDRFDQLQKERDDLQKDKDNVTDVLNDLKQKYENVDKSYANGAEENNQLQAQISELRGVLDSKFEENKKLLLTLEEKEKELSDKFEYIEVEKEKIDHQDELQTKVNQLQKKLSELEGIQKTAEVLQSKLDISESDKVKNEIEVTESRDKCQLLELKLAEFKDIRTEKEQIESEFSTLQEDDLILQKEFYELKKNNNVLRSDCAELRQDYSVLNDKYEDLLKNLETLKSEQSQKSALEEEFLNLKESASENESRLIQENVILHKQVIDLQSSLNSKITQKTIVGSQESFTYDQLINLLRQYIDNIDDLELDHSIQAIIQFIGENFKKSQELQKEIEANDTTNNQDQVDAQNSQLIDEQKRLKHENDTIRADLHHYEIEVAELMKNNELLLIELDVLKSGKLETISEQNEDNLVNLERQLEDCSKLNQNLEDEYDMLRQKLHDSVTEIRDRDNQISDLKHELQLKNTKFSDISLQLESFELEKSNLQFEVDELKTDNSKTLLEEELGKQRLIAESLNHQLETLNQDHADLVGKLQSLQKVSLDKDNRHQQEMKENQANLEEQLEFISKKDRDIKELLQEVHSLKAELEKIQNLSLENTDKDDKFAELEMQLKASQNNLDDKEKELMELGQTIEVAQKDNYVLSEKIASLTTEIDKLSSQSKENKENENLLEEYAKLQLSIEELVKEKAEMINLITIKHQENVQYHAEIQRLDSLLKLEIEKSQNCQKCTSLLEQNEIFRDKIKDMEKLQDQNNFLKEKSDILTQNLMTEQNNQRRINQEKQELIEEKTNLGKELDRLREHLIETGEAHTQETLQLQQIIDETKSKMASIEEDVRQSSNAYTSASIRANQQAETLQAQCLVLSQQREELLAKLSGAEDRESKNEAALINLQCALEQFQRNKERDIEIATHRIEKELESEKDKQLQLVKEMDNLKMQLDESKIGLLAAGRITDQLEMCQLANTSLKDELRLYQEKLENAEKKLHEIETSHADKVEKGLLKNLLIGYIVAPNNTDKLQILKLISSVLDFNQNETDKVGLNKTHVGWLSSIVNVAAGNNNAGDNYNKDSLAQAFVKFLEKESQPRKNSTGAANLLNIVQHHSVESSTSTSNITIGRSALPSQQFGGELSRTSSTSSSGIGSSNIINNNNNNQPPIAVIQPILLSDTVLQNFAPPRNSSSILKDILNDS